MGNPLIENTDKGFWHGYAEFYEQILVGRRFEAILEFGVFKGNSIRFWMEKYPNSRIVGADWLEVQPSWPCADRVEYVKVDQGDELQVSALFRGRRTFDLIIEDGSHIPQHQATCLAQGISHLTPGGIYILEDIHTSMPDHPLYKRHATRHPFSKKPKGTALSTLLAIQHLKRIGAPMTFAVMERLAQNSYLDTAAIGDIHSRAAEIRIFRRTWLPDACYKCGSAHYNYSALACECGEDLYRSPDSMTAVVFT